MPQIPEHFVTWYSDRVVILYQRKGSMLRVYVDSNPEINGDKATFFRIGAGIATQKSRGGVIPPMGVDHSKIVLTMEDWYAGDWVDFLDIEKLNYANKDKIAEAGAMALGRKTDEQILDVAAGTATAAVGNGTTTITENLVLQALQTLNDNDVPDDGTRVGVVGPREWNGLLKIETFQDADKIGPESLPFKTGFQPRRWLNATWLMHTGLKNNGSGHRQNFIWHPEAIGHAANKEITPDFDWEGKRAAWFVNNMMSMNAVRKQDEGIVPVLTNPAAAYA